MIRSVAATSAAAGSVRAIRPSESPTAMRLPGLAAAASSTPPAEPGMSAIRSTGCRPQSLIVRNEPVASMSSEGEKAMAVTTSAWASVSPLPAAATVSVGSARLDTAAGSPATRGSSCPEPVSKSVIRPPRAAAVTRPSAERATASTPPTPGGRGLPVHRSHRQRPSLGALIDPPLEQSELFRREVHRPHAVVFRRHRIFIELVGRPQKEQALRRVARHNAWP